MSDSTKYTLFPESSGLKRALFELKDLGRSDKPKLQALVGNIDLTSRLETVDGLSSKSGSPLTGTLPAEYNEKAAPIRNEINQIETDIADSEVRNAISSGLYDDTLISRLEPYLNDLLAELEVLDRELEGLAYGTRSIEKQNLYDSYVGLFNITLNTFFEVIELRPLFLETGSSLDLFLDGLGKKIDQISGQEGLDPLWDLMANWIRVWKDKDFYRDKLAGWIQMASLEVDTPRNVQAYINGDILVSVNMLNGEFALLEVAEGRLPLGLGLADGGFVVVTDNSKLFAGSYRGIRLRVTNNRGFVNELSLEGLEFRPDQAAAYTVLPNLNVSNLQVGSLLAYPIDLDGAIAGAQLLSGDFPTGVEFDTRSGQFKVADPSRLIAGSYGIGVLTFDEGGGQTEHQITLNFQTGKSRNVSFVAESPFYISELEQLQVLGKIEVENGVVAGAAPLQGGIPPGCGLSSLGVLVVERTEQLMMGTFSFPVSVTTTNQVTLTVNVEVSFQ